MHRVPPTVTVYSHRPGRRFYGSSMGLLAAGVTYPLVPGDLGYAGSFEWPVMHETVSPVFDPVELRRVTRQLVLQGAEVIGAAGLSMLPHQACVRDAADALVCLSPLLLLPMLATAVGPGRPIGVLVDSENSACWAELHLADVKSDSLVLVEPLNRGPLFASAFINGGVTLDDVALEEEIVAAAVRLRAAHATMAALLLEASMLPPYAPAIRRETGLPVLDGWSTLAWLHAATDPPRHSWEA